MTQNLSTRSRTYFKWVLLLCHEAYPIPVKRTDLGNEAFDLMQLQGRVLVVPQDADTVLDSWTRMKDWNFHLSKKVLQTLWQMIDPAYTFVGLHKGPHRYVQESLSIVVDGWVDAVDFMLYLTPHQANHNMKNHYREFIIHYGKRNNMLYGDFMYVLTLMITDMTGHCERHGNPVPTIFYQR